MPDAGIFWYHPHVMSAAQVGFGLYGALLVDDPMEQVGVIVTPRAAPGGPLVLQSLLYNRGYGSVEYRHNEDLFAVEIAKLPPYSGPPLPDVRRAIEPLSTAGADGRRRPTDVGPSTIGLEAGCTIATFSTTLTAA